MSWLFERNGIIYYGWYDPDKGRSRDKSLRLKDSRDNWPKARAKQKKYDLIYEYNIETPTELPQNVKYTFSQAFEEFKMWKMEEDRAKGTITMYEQVKKRWIEFHGDKKLYLYKKLDWINIKNHWEEEDKAQPTIASYSTHLHAIWEYFLKQGWAEANIIKKIKPNKKLPQVIPPDDLKTILLALKDKKAESKYNPWEYKHWFPIIYFMYLSGFRKSSATRLEWEDIDFDNMIIHGKNKKGKRTWIFPMHKRLYEYLQSLEPKQSGSVFGLNPDDELKFFFKIQKGLKLKKHYTIHQLRKTFASMAADINLSDGKLATLLDHKDPKTTKDSYIRRFYDSLRTDLDKMAFITVEVGPKEETKNSPIQRLIIKDLKIEISAN